MANEAMSVIATIVLTEDGDTLGLYPIGDQSLIGCHSCGGGIYCHALLKGKKDVVHCKLCSVRLVTPAGLVKKPVEFEKWCAGRIEKIKRLRHQVEHIGEEPHWAPASVFDD